jgi:uncharacterized glyoxalase superfamily protein PhnB
MQIIYIKHNNLSPGTRTFKPDTKGAELVPEMKVVSDNIFVKTKANALTSEEFTEFIEKNGINEFFIAGADATGCVKSTCFNMTKAGYSVHVISDCVTSYDLKKMDEMYAYYAKKGCEVKELKDYMEGADRLEDDRLAGAGTKWRQSMRLDGFGLLVEDKGKMIRFYRDVLGFEIKEEENTSNVYLIKDGTLFLLYGRKDFEKMTSRRYEYIKGLNGHFEIALYVDTFEEVDEAYKKAVENGATSVLEPELEPWGQRTCYIADPEGNLIEIGSWNKSYETKDLTEG